MFLSMDVFYTGAETGINKYSLADEVVSSSSCVYWQFASRLGADVTSCTELCTNVVGISVTLWKLTSIWEGIVPKKKKKSKILLFLFTVFFLSEALIKSKSFLWNDPAHYVSQVHNVQIS